MILILSRTSISGSPHLESTQGSIGIMIGPEIDESYEAVEVSYSIRVLDDSYSERHQIDCKYRFPELEVDTFLKRFIRR